MYLENNDQFTVKVADTMEDAIKLMEVGFGFTLRLKVTNCLGSQIMTAKHNGFGQKALVRTETRNLRRCEYRKN